MSLKFSDFLYYSVDDSADVMASDLSWNCHLGNEASIYFSQGAEANVGSEVQGSDTRMVKSIIRTSLLLLFRYAFRFIKCGMALPGHAACL
jgi:hypothetical protein